MVGNYDEFLERASWGPSEGLHAWVSRRVLLEFIRRGGVQPSSTSLLELGTGTGRIGVQAQKLGFRSYVGVEPTARLAKYSREQLGLEVLDNALPNLTDVASDSFDAVVSMHVLEHAPTYQAAREWCVEMARVAKPRGRILIVAPEILDYREHFWDADWSHGWPTSVERVAQVSRDVGLDISYQGVMHLGHLGATHAIAAHSASFLLPTRLGDALSKKVVGRKLASGLKIAALWGMVFVIARKPM